jgi:hypothetical protein
MVLPRFLEIEKSKILTVVNGYLSTKLHAALVFYNLKNFVHGAGTALATMSLKGHCHEIKF